MPGARTAAAGSYALELDGKDVGPLKSASGGDAFADVVVERDARLLREEAHRERQVDAAEVSVGVPMGKPLSDWIAGTVTGTPARRTERWSSGRAGAAQARRAFDDALITAVDVPGLRRRVQGRRLPDGQARARAVHHGKASGKAGVGAQAEGVGHRRTSSSRSTGSTRPGSRGSSRSRSGRRSSSSATGAGARADRRLRRASSSRTSSSRSPRPARSRGATGSTASCSRARTATRTRGTGRCGSSPPNLKDELGQVRLFNLGIFKLGRRRRDGGRRQARRRRALLRAHGARRRVARLSRSSRAAAGRSRRRCRSCPAT